MAVVWWKWYWWLVLAFSSTSFFTFRSTQHDMIFRFFSCWTQLLLCCSQENPLLCSASFPLNHTNLASCPSCSVRFPFIFFYLKLKPAARLRWRNVSQWDAEEIKNSSQTRANKKLKAAKSFPIASSMVRKVAAYRSGYGDHSKPSPKLHSALLKPKLQFML